MRKLLFIIACLMTSMMSWAQGSDGTTTASARFEVSDDGTTLTIVGQGDLTTYSKVLEKYVFTPTGREKLKNEWDGAIQSYDEYSATSKYKANKYSKVNLYPEYVDATPSYTWTDAGLQLYYKASSDASWEKVTEETTVKLDSWWENNTEYSYYSTTDSDDGRILKSVFQNGTYYTTTLNNVTFKSDKVTSLYTRNEDGTYTQLTADAKYDDTKDYFIYGMDFVSEDEMAEMGYIEHPIVSFANLLKTEIGNNGYTTVKFENEDPSSTLLINDDIVQNILYPVGFSPRHFNNCNQTITSLDLEAATVNDLSTATFTNPTEGYGDSFCLNLAKLTLPLTDKKNVKVELLDGATGSDMKMIVPENIIKPYAGDNSKLEEVTIPDGYDWVGDNAFYVEGSLNQKLKTVHLPNTITKIGDNAFRNCSELVEINLNEGLENIGKYAFYGALKPDGESIEIHLPSTLRIINEGAFALCNIKNIKFNERLYYIGDYAFGRNSTLTDDDKTLSIPASVKYIGPGAFYCREYQDVYFYGEAAPLMPMRTITINNQKLPDLTAFSEVIHNGNNGFSPGSGNYLSVENMADDTSKGYANRENYKSNKKYFCILHYPTGLDNDARAKYTDITRVYKTKRDDEGNFYESEQYTVGEETENLTFGTATAYKDVNYGYADTYLGDQYIWPSQSQWNRSYAVNSNGYNWDGVTQYRPELSEEDIRVLKYAGFEIGEGEGKYTEDELKKIAHLGTRQFVLADPDVTIQEEGDDDFYPTGVKGGKWWTIVLPFDMTKAQVDNVFGEGTHVCRFSSVSRTAEGDVKNITLRFQNDVYATKWTRDPQTLIYTKHDGTAPEDKDVVIYSHEAYMIYPTNDSQDAVFMINMADYTFVPGAPLPTIIKANKEGDTDRTEYRFVGNYMEKVPVDTEVSSASDDGIAPADVEYEDVKIPQYSYVYASKDKVNYQFWFITGSNMKWQANKCIVQATDRKGGENDFKNFFGGNANNSNVKQTSMFGGEDDEPTAIENITIIAGEGKDAQVVYSLDGKLINTNGSLDGLRKGIYIRDGKKYVVK